MRVASFLSLLFFCASCIWIALLLRFGLPQPHIIIGQNIYYVPVVIGAFQLILAILSIYLSKRVNPPPLKNPTFIRWILFVICTLILICGFIVFNVSLFSPYLFGSKHSVPKVGVASWLTTSSILAIILYFASKMNSINRPNLFRYIALGIAFIAAFLTLTQSLILIYAMPDQPATAFPFLSGLMTIAYIPYALLFFGLFNDYVKTK